MTAFYNEIDPFAAQWLRNLIGAGHIAPGVVDERSIEDISPDELSEFTQCHFFAGVGVWSLALRRAGWPDDRPVWTGSCPCQPFSSAGQGAGFTDARHLWPSFAWLIANAKPAIVFGEQVASKAVGPWVDLVHADLEALGYAFGAIPFPSAGVGAPHIRDRLYWVADSPCGGWGKERPDAERGIVRDSPQGRTPGFEHGSSDFWLADAHHQWEPSAAYDEGAFNPGGRSAAPSGMGDADVPGFQGYPRHGCSEGGQGAARSIAATSLSGRLADSDGGNPRPERKQCSGQQRQQPQDCGGLQADAPGPVNGFWGSADWLGCRDDRYRPVEPGTFPLVARPAAGVGLVQPGLSRLYGRNKTGRLKAYGNAINAEAAHEFIAAYLDVFATGEYPAANCSNSESL